MMLGELRTGFPFGVLLVTDPASSEDIPPWASPEEQVTSASTALVVRVMHQDEGEVLVRVWDDPSDVRGGLTFNGVIQLPSRVLKLSDALGETSIELPVDQVRQHIEIFTDAAHEANQVHLVIRAED